MARAATTSDVFNAIAEPRRRQIVDFLAEGESRAVGEFVVALKLTQPTVSKHLGVLRKVGLVTMSKNGRNRMYGLNALELRPVHDWVRTFERFWSHHLDRIKVRAERAAEGGRVGHTRAGNDPGKHKENPR